MWQAIQSIKSPTTQLLWQIFLDTLFFPHEHSTNIQVILTPVLPNFLISRRGEKFYKPESCHCFENTAFYSECSSEAATLAANLLSSSSRLCRINLLTLSALVLAPLRSVRILVPRITVFLPKRPFPEISCLRCSNSLKLCLPAKLVGFFEYLQRFFPTDLSIGSPALCTRRQCLYSDSCRLQILMNNSLHINKRAYPGPPL